MSALANTNTHHANVDAVKLNSEPAVTSISVTARIDYIQRFSKQAVLVIDQDTGVYTQAARQFLISLSKEKSTQETNAAYISASTKLNDIQMRCRLIEQLFANTLFDPEKSLAVSILQLSKQNKESITIVVEHAHALSLQIKYELCQLVDVANKTHHKINVVLFGKEQAAQEVATNKTIFKNKLSIIDAQSGQLFTLESAKFKNESAIFSKKFLLKMMLTLMSFGTLIGISWYLLSEFESLTLSELALFNTTKIEQPLLNQTETIKAPILANEINEQANAEDVQAALFGEVTVLTANEKVESAQATDILQALALSNNSTSELETAAVESKKAEEKPVTVKQDSTRFIETVEAEIKPEAVKPVESTAKNNLVNVNLPITLTPDYYLNLSKGYVVQIVGFSDMVLLARFVDKYPNLSYFSYQKKLNNKSLVVLTTKVFDSKAQAQLELKLLPQDIIERGTWIKSLAIVKTEILAFEKITN